jgi:ATP-dependent helicase YprA (DUF1998 family)
VTQTIQGTIQELHHCLRDYIEATYHISDPKLLEQRRRLLEQPGVIHQIPYLESTPRYVSNRRFDSITGLPVPALAAYSALASSSGNLSALLHDPPYQHQADAIEQCLVHRKNLLIMTGTGSGKTESFLLPVLGKLAIEASDKPSAFKDEPALRALILYPMNALVNDQLGRLRALFGDPRTVDLFMKWADRPPRFARYTSRTPYAGVRTPESDQRKLQPFEKYYVDAERLAKGESSEQQEDALRLLSQLKARGKWPSKPNLAAWFGDKHSKWQDASGAPRRALTLPRDVELVTRQEVQTAPPDLMVTNYSMLEYMLMRPLERPIFDKTRAWLSRNPSERFLVVLDEAHLYRGAAGAEVGLLLRRLRDRLDITPDRLQVICATASFNDPSRARTFGAGLTGTPPDTFVAIQGDFAFKAHAAKGNIHDAEVLAGIDLVQFYSAETEAERFVIIEQLLKYRAVVPQTTTEASLYAALAEFPPLGLLINLTMRQAMPVEGIPSALFQGTEASVAQAATTVLLNLGSLARPDPSSAGLLPCRIHNFFRGLVGLWVCMDPNCSAINEGEQSGVCGRMYSQPRDRCECGVRVHELYTCQYCGSAYARAYTDNVDTPSALWSEPGQRLKIDGDETRPLLPLDLFLEESGVEDLCESADYDLETGRLNPNELGPRTRRVYLRANRITQTAEEGDETQIASDTRGQFVPCGRCQEQHSYGRSSVMDHQTKGDQPFQALVTKQIQIQPPSLVKATAFAPLRGRKVLVFSDSRQVAARLAPNLQMYSTRDSLRPLIAWGYRKLQASPLVRPHLSLDDLFFAILFASKHLHVRLRPEQKPSEAFAADDIVQQAIDSGEVDTDAGLLAVALQLRLEDRPQALLEQLVIALRDRFTGFEALALASLCERAALTERLTQLPDLPGVAETAETKTALARQWLRYWRTNGFWLVGAPAAWWNGSTSQSVTVKGKKGKGEFRGLERVIPDKALQKQFNRDWTPKLLKLFCEDVNGEQRLKGSQLSLLFEGTWVRCATCKSVHRPIPGIVRCLDCTSHDIAPLDPDTDQVFLARRGFYRRPVMAALETPAKEPMAIIAAEHTAQLNSPQSEDVFSKAEENELLFQDIVPFLGEAARKVTAIDVLSSTTTMEVGIDIGALSGVALRNLPPGRANYQQRAGRAGRRGNAVATVVAFGSADSHDEHYFSHPDAMIRGDVVDPKLSLDNKDITQRHIRAFLLQRYHQDRIPGIDLSQPHDLFSVLGTVAAFRSRDTLLNISNFGDWLKKHEDELQGRLGGWIPNELSSSDRHDLLSNFGADCFAAIEEAIRPRNVKDTAPSSTDENYTPVEDGQTEDDFTSGDTGDTNKLLDRLLYRGVLPRYAFPTDVATFHVFDRVKSSRFRPVMRYAPSQGLPIALSQYAPGKQVWIASKCYSSGAVYSLLPSERYAAWEAKRLYLECSRCGFAKTEPIGPLKRGDRMDCPACGAASGFEEARYWLRPPGFAHPVYKEEVTSPDEIPETSYATRAKLTMETPSDSDEWTSINDRITGLKKREHLLVSNTGPKREGYTYCVRCGRIEASSEPTAELSAPHPKPFPDNPNELCPGEGTSPHIVLGTDFITDIVLFSLTAEDPLSLRPGSYPTEVALRTLSEALAMAATDILGLEPGELMAEFRPSLTDEGQHGLKAEVFLYDTLPGGAGFATQLIELGRELFERALQILQHCPEKCDASCYRCLRSFKNKFEHRLMDRHVGAELLQYLLTGQLPAFDPARTDKSTTLLFDDLNRQEHSGILYERHAQIQVQGLGTVPVPIYATTQSGRRFVIAVSGPLTAGHPADPALWQINEHDDLDVIVVNELAVRGNLPAATHEVRGRLEA